MNKKIDARNIGSRVGFGVALFVFISILYYVSGRFGIKFLSYGKTLLVIVAIYTAYLIVWGVIKWKK